MTAKKINNFHILKFDKGENLMPILETYIKKHQLNLCKISAIGALKNVEIGYLKEDFTYIKKIFHDDMEVLSLKGSVSSDEKIQKIHMHGVFGKSDFSTIGGHFFNGEVSAMVEMFIEIVSDKNQEKFLLGL